MPENVFTVDSLREEARKKFAPVPIGLSDGTQVELRSMLRLKKDERKAVQDALKVVNELEVDEDDDEGVEQLIEAISRVINVVADKPAKLIRDLDDDDLTIKVTLMTDVLMYWAKETQLGEAQNSPA